MTLILYSYFWQSFIEFLKLVRNLKSYLFWRKMPPMCEIWHGCYSLAPVCWPVGLSYLEHLFYHFTSGLLNMYPGLVNLWDCLLGFGTEKDGALKYCFVRMCFVSIKWQKLKKKDKIRAFLSWSCTKKVSPPTHWKTLVVCQMKK